MSFAPVDPALIPEAVTAALGFDAILHGDAKLTASARDEARGLPKRIRQDVLSWLSSDSVGKVGRVHPVTWKEANRLLFESVPADTGRLLIEALNTPVAYTLGYEADLPAAVSALVTKIIHFLADRFPRRVKSDLLGAKSVPTDPVAWIRFRRLWELACNPLIILEELRTNSLVSAQVQAVELLYPQIYAAAKQAMIDGLIALRGQRKSWSPSPRQARLVKLLLQIPSAGPDLAVSVQSQEQQQGPSPNRSTSKLALPSAATPGQAAESA